MDCFNISLSVGAGDCKLSLCFIEALELYPMDLRHIYVHCW